jgi:hypothetical protein
VGMWSRCVVLAAVVTAGVSIPGAATALPDASEVMLDDVGGGFELVGDDPGSLGSLTRTWRDGVREVSITGFPVTTPPGVHALFEVLTSTEVGLDVIPEPSLELGAWLVPTGGAPGERGFSALVIAAREHLFSINLVTEIDAELDTGLDGPAFVLGLAERQISAAGGQPSGAPPLPSRSVDDEDLLPYLPEAAPSGYGLGANPLTVAGATALETDSVMSPEAADFLNDRARNVARAWASPELSVAVGITQYPYAIFAAAGLTNFDDLEPLGLPPAALAWLPDAVAFREPELSRVGVVFRRGDLLVTVLVAHTAPANEAIASALLVDMAALVDQRVPAGDTWPYEFPSPPTRLAWLALTAAFVTAGVAGSRLIARARARRVRRRWSASGSPPMLAPPGAPPVHVVDLEDDAAALRRRGATVAGAQLITVNAVVVALAGDFALVGVVVAAVALLVGLAFSRWWLRRELALLGPAAPPRAFVLPHWSGAALGAVAIVVLGIGVSYMLKGVRYTIASPSMAHLRWSDLLGIAPRRVGAVFALGGLAVTALGSVLYRIARALGRADARRVLQIDPRPPALYLRSFDDDTVPLPTIASARRPLFELFSLRGADPFEEAVAWELDSYGPVVAVGRPGGSLHSLGAAREHLPDSTWRGEIAQRMNHAGLVVLAPGETAGLEWELQEIVRGDHLDKTIFLFPPLPPPDLARRWEHTARVLRTAGAEIGTLTETSSRVHTLRVGTGGALRVTAASARDEATYRTAVDRAIDIAPVEASSAVDPA